ncbi:MAG: formate--tetrahydrofolate ligase [Alphaproteobacteria bacterium]|nr:formate--tetrahydrofolate ligase [Alphaproteobacteria bacterium]
MPSDIEIARAVRKRPMAEVAAKIGVPADALIPYGFDKAKIAAPFLKSLAGKPDGALVLVTAVNPTPAGEGKTTTTIGLGDALNRIGKRAAICIREPSLGPCFGQKGGATGGGHAQVIPMDDINLHFTGDFHAITTAHNLLAAMVDNHLYWGNAQNIDPRRVVWRRVMDMNDRSLRDMVTSLGGNGAPAESGFDITVASEVMAILCLAKDLDDLQARLGRIIVAYRNDRTAVTCADMKADGAMTALLKDAMQPNLVQTLEGNPALIHGGPFANIAHGCNSVIATTSALKLADYVVTEAGFGADLGAEKFFDIKCRKAGLSPKAVVIVATIRSLKMNGGLPKNRLATEDLAALERGCENLGRHIENIRLFGVPAIVAINHFVQDTPAEIATVKAYAQAMGSEAILCRHWADGSAGTEALARRVVEVVERGEAKFAPIYGDDLSLMEKIETVARKIYRAESVVADKAITDRLARWEKEGFGALPVCMAKTQYSFTTDPTRLGAPHGHEVRIREVRLAAGAGFVVAICGDIMTMPGLPKTPAAEGIGVNANGNIEGLF